MFSDVYVIPKFGSAPVGGIEVDTTSRGSFKDLSPFFLGPVSTYEFGVQCRCVENLWQFAKVYQQFVDQTTGEPSPEYFRWRNEGWKHPKAFRYPMGKGAKPLYSYWAGQRLDYISARKTIYIPAYANCVTFTESYAKLFRWYTHGHVLILRDFDGYDLGPLDHGKLLQVINNPRRPMGHAFVLAMMLKGCLEEAVA